MSDIKTSNSTSDIELVGGDFFLTIGLDDVAQMVRHRLKTFSAEWFLDLDEGLPYYDQIFVKTPNLNVVDAIIKQRILSTTGVLELMEFELSYDNATRGLTVQATIRGYDGIIDFSTTLGA